MMTEHIKTICLTFLIAVCCAVPNLHAGVIWDDSEYSAVASSETTVLVVDESDSETPSVVLSSLDGSMSAMAPSSRVSFPTALPDMGVAVRSKVCTGTITITQRVECPNPVPEPLLKIPIV